MHARTIKLCDILTTKRALVMSEYCVTECAICIPVVPSNNRNREFCFLITCRDWSVTEDHLTLVAAAERYYTALNSFEQCLPIPNGTERSALY